MATSYFTQTDLFERQLIKEGLGETVGCPFIQRLKNVSYLSTMDYIYDLKHRFSRYDHSLGTAFTAMEISDLLKLSRDQKLILACANLVHDAGHFAFSHASETFLLEAKRKYHGGLMNYYLRQPNSFPGYRKSLGEVLANDLGSLSQQVIKLVTNGVCDDSIVNQLHNFCLNCDKIDGTNRTLFALGLDFFQPAEFLKVFALSSNTVVVLREHLESVLRFWDLKKMLYNKHIYSYEVSASEAMLTRSLEGIVSANTSMEKMLALSDNEILEIGMESQVSGFIIEKFISKKYFASFVKNFPQLILPYKLKFMSHRFNNNKRRQFECEIAQQFGWDPRLVISHFSFRKKFVSNNQPLQQMDFFNAHDLIPLVQLNTFLYKTRLSGNYFDIFYDPSIPFEVV